MKLVYVKHFGKVAGAVDAVMKGIDSKGMTITYKPSAGAEEKEIKIPFQKPLQNPKEAREVLVAMSEEGAKALGVTIKKDGPSPTTFRPLRTRDVVPSLFLWATTILL
ncbi:hypothetical protein HK102_001091, partial [Quaeritorhiza haematococci]